MNSGSFTDTSSAAMLTVVSNVAITASGPTNVCLGDSVTLCINITTTNMNIQWYSGSQSTWTPIAGASGNCYTVHPINTVDYFAVLTNVSGGSNQSNIITVSVNTNAISSIIPTGNYYVCNITTGTLVANVVAGQSYQWYLNGASISGATNTTYTFNAQGNYQMFVNTGACQAFSDTTHVIFQANPTATAGVIGATIFCNGGSVTLMANNNPNYQYQWYSGAMPITGANAFSYTTTIAGNYSVQETFNTCTGISNSISVTVNPTPTAQIAVVSGSTIICQGDSALIIANTGVGLTYQWLNTGTPIPNATNPAYYASVTGSYQVVVTNSINCSSTSISININVVPNPAPNVVVTGHSLSTFGYLIYQWYLNGVLIVGATNDTYTATVSGNYSVHVVSTNGCGVNSQTYLITVGIDEVDVSSSIVVYPNPAKDNLTVQFMDEGILNVIDVTGRVLNSYVLQNSSNTSAKKFIDVGQFSSGYYLLKYQCLKYSKTVGFMKE